MSSTLPSPAVRLIRLLRPGRNPIARGVDRAEGIAVTLFMLLALVLVPVMLTLGSLTYANLAEQSAQQARTRHKTVAVLTEDTSETNVGTRGEVVNATSKVTARW
jgi:hypothetical protein